MFCNRKLPNYTLLSQAEVMDLLGVRGVARGFQELYIPVNFTRLFCALSSTVYVQFV